MLAQQSVGHSLGGAHRTRRDAAERSSHETTSGVRVARCPIPSTERKLGASAGAPMHSSLRWLSPCDFSMYVICFDIADCAGVLIQIKDRALVGFGEPLAKEVDMFMVREPGSVFFTFRGR
eukprot:3999316-Pyramimonas_sp.AAC.1